MIKEYNGELGWFHNTVPSDVEYPLTDKMKDQMVEHCKLLIAVMTARDKLNSRSSLNNAKTIELTKNLDRASKKLEDFESKHGLS